LTPDDNLVTITFPAAISSTSQAGNDPVYRSTRLTQPINLIDTGQVLKSFFGPGVLEEPEEPEAVFTESPTGIAYGTSVFFLPSFPSALDVLVLDV
jgi:hypothetical protein